MPCDVWATVILNFEPELAGNGVLLSPPTPLAMNSIHHRQIMFISSLKGIGGGARSLPFSRDK